MSTDDLCLVLMCVAPLSPIVRAENGIQREFKPRLAKDAVKSELLSQRVHKLLGNSRSPYFFDLILICLVWQTQKALPTGGQVGAHGSVRKLNCLNFSSVDNSAPRLRTRKPLEARLSRSSSRRRQQNTQPAVLGRAVLARAARRAIPVSSSTSSPHPWPQ